MINTEIKKLIHKNVYQNASEGYVLTPSELAYEMVDTLPIEVFISDKTTFLDPICKSGTFLFEIVERLYEQGHYVENISRRIFTVDDNSHSLNIANSYIIEILNKKSGKFKIDFKDTELYFNYLIRRISNNKYSTFNQFLDIILLDKKDIYLMEQLQKSVNEFIKEYEKVSKLESKLFGEVFTPRQLIDEMLDTLPKEVWQDYKLKWLDPAVGIGNFPAAIKDRYMESLVKYFPNDKDREKHILENMLYMCDISIKNLFILYNIFDRNNEFKLNVYRGSFLEEGFDKHMKEVWGLDGFDIIVGNPPYQVTNATGDNKLYLDFSKKSIFFLNKNALLLFVTPKNIIDYILLCDKNRIYFDNFYQIDYLAIDTPAKYFKGVGSTFIFFLLRKKDYVYETKIEFLDSNNNEVKATIKLNKGESIPNSLSEVDLSIINKIMSKKNLFDFKKMKINKKGVYKEFRIRNKQIESGQVSKEKKDDYIYPVIDGINKNNPFPGKIFYIKENYSDNKMKIIFNGSGYLCPSFEENGNYFLSDNILYLEIDNKSEYDSYMFIFNSKIVKYWLSQFRLNGFSDSKNIRKFPKISLTREWLDQELYEYFNLTQEEIDLIEKTIKD